MQPVMMANHELTKNLVSLYSPSVERLQEQVKILDSKLENIITTNEKSIGLLTRNLENLRQTLHKIQSSLVIPTASTELRLARQKAMESIKSSNWDSALAGLVSLKVPFLF